jgi:hypothetical protein
MRQERQSGGQTQQSTRALRVRPEFAHTLFGALPKLQHVASLACVLLLADTSSAFTTKGGPGGVFPAGHEELIMMGAKYLGGVYTEPSVTELNTKAACGAGCDSYHTKNWKSWSVIMGNRWLDIGGYDVLGDPNQQWCWKYAIQESDDVQYGHALRKRCDVGGDGLQATYKGVVATIKSRFMMAVAAPDDPKGMWFRDGGASVKFYMASRPYFFLGLAVHTLQDTFSKAHTRRDQTFRTLVDFNSYVDTPGATPHPHESPAAEDLIQPPGAWAPWDPNNTFAWWKSKLRPSAQEAYSATVDLLTAFDAVKNRGEDAAVRWQKFADDWLKAALDPLALNAKSDSNCVASNIHEGKRAEEWRVGVCFLKAGIEQQLLSDKYGTQVETPVKYPRFCWNDNRCPP